MLCAISSRKLKPGAWEDFRRAWQPPEFPPALMRAYHVRALDDENRVVSFGLLDGTRDDIDRIRGEISEGEEERQRRMAEFVETTYLDGIFEVIDEVTP
jgi:hypothetical protein